MKTLFQIALGLFLMLVITQLGMAQSAPPLPMFPAGAGYAYRKLRKKA